VITVATFGVHYLWTQRLPEELREQLGLEVWLWNALVDSYEAYTDDKNAIWSSYPQIAALEAAADAAADLAEELWPQVAEARKQERTLTPKHPSADRYAAAEADHRAARESRRKAIAAVSADAKPRIAAAAQAHHDRVKALYEEAMNRGMYWGTFNDITRRRFAAAVKRVEDLRAQARPASLARRRPDGTGTVTVQLQRQTGQPQRRPATIADPDGKWRNVLHLPWTDPATWSAMTRADRRRAGRVTARIRIGQHGKRNPIHLDVPVQIGARQLHPDADITEARLTVRRYGPDLRARLTVVAHIPDPTPSVDGPTIALHMGWRDLDATDPAGPGIQVASVRVDGPPPPVPDALADILVFDTHRPGDTTCAGRIVIPAALEERFATPDRYRATRDAALNVVRGQLTDWITEHGPLPMPSLYRDPDGPQEVTTGTIGTWRSPARYVVLGRYLSGTDDPPPADVTAPTRNPMRGELDIDEIAALDITHQAIESYRRQHRATRAAADAALRRILEDFLLASHREDRQGSTILSRAGYQIRLSGDRSAITRYSTGRVITWEETRADARDPLDNPAAAWADSGPAKILAAWQIADQEQWRAQEHGRARVIAHRDDVYANAAAALARHATHLVIDDSSIAALARTPSKRGPNAADDILPPDVRAAAAHRRTIAAPGRFRAAAVSAFTRDHGPGAVVTVPSKNLSREHTCGKVNADQTRPDARRSCGGCGRDYDPDRNATVLMLRRAEAQRATVVTEA
jgi:hypothetical protein